MEQDIKNLHLALQSGSIRAVIFDLDGVLVTTDNAHYLAWKRMADEEGIYFDRTINERLRGVSRMESLAIILERADKTYTEAKKIEMATRKNEYYKELICSLTSQAILPGALAFIDLCRTYKLKIAIGSSSKNTKAILAQVGLANAFDAIADGNDIKQSKPAPDVFLTAAEKLGIPAQDCIVVKMRTPVCKRHLRQVCVHSRSATQQPTPQLPGTHRAALQTVWNLLDKNKRNGAIHIHVSDSIKRISQCLCRSHGDTSSRNRSKSAGGTICDSARRCTGRTHSSDNCRL